MMALSAFLKAPVAFAWTFTVELFRQGRYRQSILYIMKETAAGKPEAAKHFGNSGTPGLSAKRCVVQSIWTKGFPAGSRRELCGIALNKHKVPLGFLNIGGQI